MKHIVKGKKLSLIQKISLGIIPIIFCIIIILLFTTYYHATEEALIVIQDNEMITVTEKEGNLIFSPHNRIVHTGFIFYPGAMVEYKAYAPLMQKIAKEGYLCILVKMPFHLAVLDSNAAQSIVSSFDSISSWYIGGHSLGGAMATTFASKNKDLMDGVILLGSYPAADISSYNEKVLVMLGTCDLVVNQKKYKASFEYMPIQYREIIIEGGNHAQFGNYGKQRGDGVATISTEEQQERAAKEIVNLFESVK